MGFNDSGLQTEHNDLGPKRIMIKPKKWNDYISIK